MPRSDSRPRAPRAGRYADQRIPDDLRRAGAAPNQWRDHRRPPAVHGVDDLARIDALEVSASDAEVSVGQLLAGASGGSSRCLIASGTSGAGGCSSAIGTSASTHRDACWRTAFAGRASDRRIDRDCRFARRSGIVDAADPIGIAGQGGVVLPLPAGQARAWRRDRRSLPAVPTREPRTALAR
jgi:hypothetical protein